MVRDVQVVHWVTADHVVAEQRTLCPGITLLNKVFKYFAGGKGIHWQRRGTKNFKES